jgi:hypothetical protein
VSEENSCTCTCDYCQADEHPRWADTFQALDEAREVIAFYAQTPWHKLKEIDHIPTNEGVRGAWIKSPGRLARVWRAKWSK